MTAMQTDPNDLTLKEYNFWVRILVKEVAAQQGELGGQSSFNVVLLLPQESTQRQEFYKAWLPDQTYEGEGSEAPEIIISSGFPLGHAPFRGAVINGSRFWNAPHIFVMSPRVEDILKNMNGRKILIKVHSSSADLELDPEELIRSDRPTEIHR